MTNIKVAALGRDISRHAPKYSVAAELDASADVAYKGQMIELRQTREFRQWRQALRDLRAKAAIAKRMVRVGAGNWGDAKYLGAGVSELRFDIGPGYRVYYYHSKGVVILLCGGDKGSQTSDITMAKAIVSKLDAQP